MQHFLLVEVGTSLHGVSSVAGYLREILQSINSKTKMNHTNTISEELNWRKAVSEGDG